MFNWKRFLALVAACLLMSLSACGDDSGDDGDASAGDGDGDGDNGDGDGDAPADCGGEVCSDDGLGGIIGTACCTIESDVTMGSALEADKCGLNIAMIGPVCVQKDQPGEDDANCPDVDMMGMTFAGCCTSTGVCGNRYDAIMLGCTGPTDPATAVECGGGDQDGGADDAGMDAGN